MDGEEGGETSRGQGKASGALGEPQAPHTARGNRELEAPPPPPPPPLSRMLGTEGAVPGPQRTLRSHVIKMDFSQITEPGQGEGGIRQVWRGEGTFQSPLPLGN